MTRFLAVVGATTFLALSPVGCGSQPASREVEGKLRTQVPATVGKPGASVRGE